MKAETKALIGAIVLISVVLITPALQAADDPLPSWNDGAAKQGIVKFVTQATEKGGANYVAPADRIATFDQDGTLWVEHPLYTQGVFALDRVKALAPGHPEWKTTEPFKAVLADDRAAMAKFGEQDWAHIIAATHAGVTTEAFLQIVKVRRAFLFSVGKVSVLRGHSMLNGFIEEFIEHGGPEWKRWYWKLRKNSTRSLTSLPKRPSPGSFIASRGNFFGSC